MNSDEIRPKINEMVRAYFRNQKNTNLLPVRYGGSLHGEDEAIEMINAILDGWWIGGKRTAEFESIFNNYTGSKHSVLCNSGSSALMLAFDSLNLENGSEIISPALTFPTTINPAIRQQMRIILVDSDIGTYNINVDELEKAINKKTKALVLPHIMGNMSDMNRIMDLVEDNNLILLEDCCEAIGSTYKNRLLGSFGTTAAFSFFPSHHISAGGGGIVTTSQKDVYLRILSLKNWGRMYSDVKYIPNQGTIRSDYAQQYMYETIGYNFNASEIMAAKGIIQMKKLKKLNKMREINFSLLYKFFKKFEDIFVLPTTVKNANPSWFAFPLTLKTNNVGKRFTREELMDFLFKKQIETRYILCGNIAKQPAYAKAGFFNVRNLPNASRVFTDSFFIGVYGGITKEKMKYIQESFSEFLSAR